MIDEQATDALPVRFGTAVEFEALRDALAAHGYTTAEVCRRMEIPDIYAFRTVREGRAEHHDVADALDVLIRLFLDGEAVQDGVVRGLLGEGALAGLTALGLLQRHPTDAARVAASVMLYPTAGLYLISDCGPSAPGMYPPEQQLRPDSVYAAITQNTRNFLRMLPSSPCDRLLELCSGTGIAALIGSRTAGRAWAVDITERSTRFAEFNARLNGIGNVTALEGDLYAPVAGLSFDRIVAHPPYVPSPERRHIYAHGGHDGEEVIRGILAGLGQHLSPGGRFYCTCATTDRRGAAAEQRIRHMLGERQEEFDVLLIEHYGFHPTELHFRRAIAGEITLEKAAEHHRLFRELEAERTVYCTMIIERHAAERPPLTLRRDRGERAGSREAEWLMNWSTSVAEGGALARLLELNPAISPHARLHVTHAAEAGAWKAERCEVITDYPFPRTVELSTGAAMLLASCDGRQSTREVLRRLREQGVVPAEMTDEAFAGFVQNLVGEGILQLGQLSLPGTGTHSQLR
jgi:SAM-dependent methyltransferase